MIVLIPTILFVIREEELVNNVEKNRRALKVFQDTLLKIPEKRTIEQWQQQFRELLELTIIQMTEGSYDMSPYDQGLANGLILAVSCFTDWDPTFMEQPKLWRRNRKGKSVNFNKE